MRLAVDAPAANEPRLNARPAVAASTRSISTPTEALGALAVLGFLFALYSRIFEFVGASLHVPLILSGVALSMALFSGRFFRKLKNPLTTLLVALTVWMLISTVFSVWVSGSVDEMWNRWLKNSFAYVLIVVNIRTVAQLRMLFRVLAAAFATVVGLGFTVAILTPEARLALRGGMYANPNEFALALGSGLVLFWLVALDKERGLWRLPAIAFVPAFLYLLLKSGSRGVTLAVAVAFCYTAWKSPTADKIKIMIALPLAAVIVLSFSGGLTMGRFEEALGQGGEVDGSTSERMQLLQDSLRLTAQNPIFGAGPGMFMVSQNDLAKDRGWRRGNWNGTHNTYAQFSSETGIPGLLLFLGIMYVGFTELARVAALNRMTPSPWQGRMHTICHTVQTLWILYAVSFVFFHYVFSFFLPALVGIAAATVSCLDRELALVKARTLQGLQPSPAGRAAKSLDAATRLRA